MTGAYSEAYLDDAMRNLGEAFDYAVVACDMSADAFCDLFVSSGFADEFARGNPRLVSGLSGTELVMETLSRTGLEKMFSAARVDYGCSSAYWCGWSLAYCQWKTGRSFRDIHAHLSMDDMLSLYPTLHEASEDKFVDTVEHIIARKCTPTKLQSQRKTAGLTQVQLAKRAQVNLRTLQQYETGAKDIGKASVSTVLSLARVLGCRIEDLLEVPVPA